MTTALVIQHTPTETPGAFTAWWAAAGLDLDIRHVYDGDPLPTTAADLAALVVLGGPQTVVGGPGEIPAGELSLMREAVSRSVPTLGICLGAQLMAAACGGTVERGVVGEHGVATITLTPSVADDALLGTLGEGPRRVVQWHGDGITALPSDAVVLAGSELFPVQAFRIGTAAWGFQFHAEATAEMVGHWSVSDPADAVDALTLLKQVEDLQPEFEAAWRPCVTAFAEFAHKHAAEVGQ